MRKFCVFVASGFGVGLVVPFAPGTFALLAIPFCDVAEKALGIKDDGRITADEWMLYPIALAGIPLATLPWWSMLVFFCVIRAVDILKPWPCRGLQSIPGGRGIVIDDFFANLYSLAVNWVIVLVLFR